MILFSFRLKQAARTTKSIRSQRLVAGNAGEPRRAAVPLKANVGDARVHAYTAIDVIDWPRGFCRDTGGDWRMIRSNWTGSCGKHGVLVDNERRVRGHVAVVADD